MAITDQPVPAAIEPEGNVGPPTVTTSSPVLHRTLDVKPWEVESRHGPMMFAHGVPVLDMSSGAGVSCLGQIAINEPGVSCAHTIYAHAQNWTHRAVEELAEVLLRNAWWQNGGVMFLSSGTEAVEAAIKLALQSQFEQGRRGIPSICARRHSYHGNSLAMLAVGHHPRRTAFREVVATFPVFRFPAYMPSWDQEQNEPNGPLDYIHTCLKAIEGELIKCQDENRPAVVVIEPIAGMTLGVEPGNAWYLVTLRALCSVYGATLIYDEVFCGNWRTGYPYAWQYYQKMTPDDVSPDIVAIGKGLANGFVPLSAVVMNASTRATLKSNRIWHSSTFQNHPYCCAIAVQVQEAQKHLVAERNVLMSSLANVAAPALRTVIPDVSVHGVGALYGIRLNKKIPNLHVTARKQLLEAGVNVYSDGGTVEGMGNTLLLAPPYTIAPNTFEWGVNVLTKVLASL